MQWFDNKYDLQYYNQPEGVPCYCEALVRPADMMLQGFLPAVPGNSYTLQVDVYSADGNTKYEDASSYFSYFFGSIPDGRRYFNAKMKTWSPAMCTHECYVLNVIVKNNTGAQVFNQWTERYCQANCCDEVEGITFTQSGVQPSPIVVGTAGPVLPGGPLSPIGPAKGPANNCGDVYITITTWFDCYDKFTGDYYGNPKDVYSGSAFQYRKITNLRGLIRLLPRDIKREYSVNCRLQRVESVTQYQVIGFDAFAGWKMRELEDQLHASHISINNYTGIKGNVEYSGGTPFKLLQVGYNCTPFYALDATVNDCAVSQIFGCGDSCDTQGSKPLGMVIPAAQGSMQYYDENKNYLGNTAEELINYYRTQPGVENVEVLDEADYDCNFTTAFIVYGTEYLPTSVYVNGTRARNRVFGQSEAAMNDLCKLIKPACATPYIGTAFVETSVCDTPLIGVVFNEAYPEEELYLTGRNLWVLDEVESFATRSQNTVVLKLDVFNDAYTYDSSDPEAELPVVGDTIAYIGGSAWPKQMKTFTHADNSSIPVDGFLVVNTDGTITYSGSVTTADLTGSHVQITNIIYTL